MVRLKVFSIGNKTAEDLDLQGETEDIDIEALTEEEAKRKFGQERNRLINDYIANKQGISITMNSTGEPLPPRGEDSVGWRSEIAQQLDIKEPDFKEQLLRGDKLTKKIEEVKQELKDLLTARDNELKEIEKQAREKIKAETKQARNERARIRRQLKQL